MGSPRGASPVRADGAIVRGNAVEFEPMNEGDPMQSRAKTVTEYLAGLPDDRRAALKAVRAMIKQNMPKGYIEDLGYGMIAWSVPLAVYRDTYNKQPLMYAALASQKNYMSVYLMCAYGDSPVHKKLVAGFKAAGKKLDMGKSCIRFKQLDDLPLDAIADAVAAVPLETYVDIAKRAHAKRK